MCGLLALLSLDGPADRAAAGRALARLAHRGPDGEGTVVRWDERLLLGHRRLAILDTGEGGRQPMIDPDTGSTVVFNGAIYNFLELRGELEGLGHHFRSDCDTEVILAGWRQWGVDAFRRFNGMWAVVLHDAVADELVVCRDRLGIKPLYHAAAGKRVVFASELRATAAAAGLPAVPDAAAIHDFLVAGLTEHDGRSFIDGVAEVPPGALWRVARDGTITRERFHDWPDAAEAGSARDDPEQLRALLTDATRLRLRADVPTMALLSSGLDSSIVAWAAAGTASEGRSRFEGLLTYGYRGDEAAGHDESARAAAIAAHVAPGLRHVIHRADPVPPLADLDALLGAQEQPFNTPSVIAGFRLYNVLRGMDVKVALTGEGADELFGGYTRRTVSLLIREQMRGGRLGDAIHTLRSPHASMGLLRNRLVWDLPVPAVRAALRRHRANAAVIARPFWEESAERFKALRDDNRRPLAERLNEDVRRTLLPYSLRSADRSSMASGVEVRSPFHDHRLVELALRLPVLAKVSAEGGKLPLRRAFAGILPDAVVTGAKTHGLGMAEQFQVGRLDLAEVLDAPPEAAHRFLDIPALRQALARRPNDMVLWWPVCLLLWLGRLERGWP